MLETTEYIIARKTPVPRIMWIERNWLLMCLITWSSWVISRRWYYVIGRNWVSWDVFWKGHLETKHPLCSSGKRPCFLLVNFTAITLATRFIHGCDHQNLYRPSAQCFWALVSCNTSCNAILKVGVAVTVHWEYSVATKASELVPCSLLPHWNSMRFFTTVSLYE